MDLNVFALSQNQINKKRQYELLRSVSLYFIKNYNFLAASNAANAPCARTGSITGSPVISSSSRAIPIVAKPVQPSAITSAPISFSFIAVRIQLAFPSGVSCLKVCVYSFSYRSRMLYGFLS